MPRFIQKFRSGLQHLILSYTGSVYIAIKNERSMALELEISSPPSRACAGSGRGWSGDCVGSGDGMGLASGEYDRLV